MDLKELSSVDPDVHWYYQSKLSALRLAIARHGFDGGQILDVGAGSGFFSTRLSRDYPGTSVFCVDPNYMADQLRTEEGLVFTHRASAEEKRSSTLFLFIDVLEHVSDDATLLSEYIDSASPGALVAITVPAFMSLWSGHDIFLEHHRRYRIHQVTRLARAKGLHVLHAQYLFGATFLPLWAMRRVTRHRRPATQMKPSHPLVNRALESVLTFEHQKHWNPIAGSSVMVIAKVGDRG